MSQCVRSAILVMAVYFCSVMGSAALPVDSNSPFAPVPPVDVPQFDVLQTHEPNYQSDRGFVEVAQALDPAIRIGQLEETVRQLTGRVEELGFQMLQMQEQMRQMQEDNEFRFQELERGSTPLDGLVGERGNLQVPNDTNASNATLNETADVPVQLPPETDIATATPPLDLGAGSENNGLPGVELPEQPDVNVSNETVLTVSADELFKAGYSQILAGDYKVAEATFEDYVAQFPDGAQLPDAHFWLGEAQYSQGAFKDAARTFLDAHQAFPNATKGPDTLLKLGMSLIALDNKETACATYREVLNRYPNASQIIKDRVASEQAAAKC